MEVLGCGWEGGWWMRFLFLVLECVCELADIVLRLRIVLTEMLSLFQQFLDYYGVQSSHHFGSFFPYNFTQHPYLFFAFITIRAEIDCIFAVSLLE